MRILKFFTFLIPLACSVTALADNSLVQQQLKQQAEFFVSSRLLQTTQEQGVEQKIESMPLDPRINVPTCLQPYEFTTNSDIQTQSAITVKASCPGKNWFLFFVVNVKQQQAVVIATSALSPGTILTSQNTQIAMKDKNRLRSTVFTDQDSIFGARTKRRLSPGQPIQPQQLCFVCKGDRIVISANASGLKIKTSGVAQQDGNVGDTIMVRNSKSRKIISARVADVNTVNVRI